MSISWAEGEIERVLSRFHAQSPTQGSHSEPRDHDQSRNQEVDAQLAEPPRCPSADIFFDKLKIYSHPESLNNYYLYVITD